MSNMMDSKLKKAATSLFRQEEMVFLLITSAVLWSIFFGFLIAYMVML